ncbi:MAG: hypothetical protein ACRDHX_14080 [Chloroflexota bacterium]
MPDAQMFTETERDRGAAVEELLDQGNQWLIPRLGVRPGYRPREGGTGGGPSASRLDNPRWAALLPSIMGGWGRRPAGAAA